MIMVSITWSDLLVLYFKTLIPNLKEYIKITASSETNENEKPIQI